MMRVHNSDGVTFGSDYSSNTLLFLINTQTTGVLRVNDRAKSRAVLLLIGCPDRCVRRAA